MVWFLPILLILGYTSVLTTLADKDLSLLFKVMSIHFFSLVTDGAFFTARIS